MIKTKLQIEQKDYDTLFQRIKKVPVQYLDEVNRFIDFVLYRSIQTAKSKVNEPEQTSGLEDFYGCMNFDGDPLVIQKRLRNEWN